MKMFAKCFMAIVVIIVTITVPYIDADHLNGRIENVADDGTGYKGEWAANDVHTAHVNVYVTETEKRFLGVVPYIEKSESAYFSTAKMSSNWELNVGGYYLNIGSYRATDAPKIDNYEGSDSDSLYDCFGTLSSTADKVSSKATAHVDPDDDSDAGEIEVRM